MTERITPRVAERFWKRVVLGPHPDDCWVWTGAVGDDGYGRVWLPGDRAISAHRLAYQLVVGSIGPDTVIRHWCDFPLCVHADPNLERGHLLAGTTSQNMIDRTRAGHFANQYTGALPHTRRADRTAALRRIRDHTRDHGYDGRFISETLAGHDTTHPTLFDY